MTTTWTVVFTLAGMRDTSEELKQSQNELVGAQLNRALAERLRERGWDFGEAFPEDFGWIAESAVQDDGKSVGVDLTTSSELKAAPDGGAQEDRWRVVVGMDLGVRSQTRASRMEHLKRLARDVHAACEELGATSITWEVGGS